MDGIEVYQKDILNYIKKSKLDAIYLYHNFLSDYAKTSLLISYMKMNDLKAKGVIIVSSTVGVNLYNKLLKELKVDYKYFEILNHYNFERIIGTNSNYCSDRVVIIDKMHYYSNSKKIVHALIAGLNKAKYRILISSVMLSNKSADIIPVLAILHKMSFKDSEQLYKASLKDQTISEKLLSGYISYYRPKEADINIYENNVLINMSEKTYNKYNIIEKIYINKLASELSELNILEFLDLFKQELQSTGYYNDKLQWIITKLKSNSSKNKTIIYINKNPNDLMGLLKDNGIKFNHINSEMNYITRNNIIKSFNQLKSGILLISSHKKDIPLYLSDIKNLIIVDPQLNNENIQSLIDNIILTESQLNKKKSNVKDLYIYTLLIKKPSTTNLIQKLKEYFMYNKVLSIDQWYQDIIDTNKKYMKMMLKKVKFFAIEKQFK